MQKDLFDKGPLAVNARQAKRAIAMRVGDLSADRAIEGFGHDTRVSALTNGAFSLINLIRATLKKTGPANVIISTWSAGFYDSKEIHQLLSGNQIIDFKIILDRSFKTRQKEYSTHITDLFTPENIRTTDTHAKFVLIWNRDWNVCIRTSMNLNENRRCENFDMDDDLDVFRLFKDFVDELFVEMDPGIIEDRSRVDPVFDKIFGGEKSTTTKKIVKNQVDDLFSRSKWGNG